MIADFVQSVAGERRVRRLVAAALPMAVIVFALVPLEGDRGVVEDVLAFAVSWVRFLVGALLGVIGLAGSRALVKSDAEIATAIYILFLSLVANFIVCCFIEGVTRNLHVFLFGLIIGGGLYVVFRGPPSLRPVFKARESPPPPPPSIG
jgi:hypothetical protein